MIRCLKYTHTLENLYNDFCFNKPLTLGIFLDLTRLATYSSILPWIIPWTEEPGGLQSMGLQSVGIYLSYLATRHIDPQDPNQPHLALLTHFR